MLVKGNSKLGNTIHMFGLPAVSTCPRATEVCKDVCYATRGRYNTTRARQRLKSALAASRRESFTEVMTAVVEFTDAKVIRVHDSGDFYSPAYAKKWLAVMRRCPETYFYLYTRMWRQKSVNAVLVEMAKLHNVFVWYSLDRETGLPKRKPARVRYAYLMTNEDDLVPDEADLVFRTKKLRSAHAATVEGVTGKRIKLCPTETGLPGDSRVTCATCRLCHTDAENRQHSLRASLTVLE